MQVKVNTGNISRVKAENRQEKSGLCQMQGGNDRSKRDLQDCGGKQKYCFVGRKKGQTAVIERMSKASTLFSRRVFFNIPLQSLNRFARFYACLIREISSSPLLDSAVSRRYANTLPRL